MTNLAQAWFKVKDTPGSVISIDGGTSGLNYTNDLTITNSVTIYGSREDGHNGTVTIEGVHTVSAVTTNFGPVAWYNLTLRATTTTYLMSTGSWTTNTFEDIRIVKYLNTSASSRYVIAPGAQSYSIWRRCLFRNSHSQASAKATLWLSAANSHHEFYNCHFDLYSGVFNYSSASTNTFVNCLVTYPTAGSDYWLIMGNSAGQAALLTNCFILNSQGVASDGANTPLLVDHCIWTADAGTPGQTNFDSAGKAVFSNSSWVDSTHDPAWVGNNNTQFGEMFIRVDDMGHELEASNAAVILNPEIKVHMAFHCGQLNPPTANAIKCLRWLVNNGNPVGTHSSTHSYYNTSNTIHIGASGTSPTVTIAGSRSGDSTNWTGTMSVAIGTEGVDRATNTIDLASSSYDTIMEVTNYWGGRAVGDGTVTNCTLDGNTKQGTLRSLVLADVSNFDISGGWKWLAFSNLAFARSEFTEAALDLENFIKFGTDRAGNAVASAGVAAAGTLASNYVCQFVAAPGNQSDPTMSNELTLNTNLVMAFSVSPPPTTAGNTYAPYYGLTNAAFNILGITSANFGSNQDGKVDPRARAAFLESALGPRINTAYFHGQPCFETAGNVGTTNLKTMLLKYGLGQRTAIDYFAWIRTNADFSSNSLTFTFTNISDVSMSRNFYKGNFLPTRRSPFVDAGTYLGDGADIRNYRIPRNGGTDIGPYERQQE